MLYVLFPRPSLPVPSLTEQTCEDYRASATIDLDHDRADRSAGKKLSVAKLRSYGAGRG